MLRAVGTTAGVLIGLAADAVLPPGWSPLVALTALLQAYARRTHAVQTLLLTPVMLLLADPLGQAGSAVPGARLLDTLIGCALAFLLGHLLRPEDTRARVLYRLAELHEAVAEYAEYAEYTGSDAEAPHALRRRNHHELAGVGAELERLRTDPRHREALPGRRDELERAEAATARLTALAAGGGPGEPARDLARRLRESARRPCGRRGRGAEVELKVRPPSCPPCPRHRLRTGTAARRPRRRRRPSGARRAASRGCPRRSPRR